MVEEPSVLFVVIEPSPFTLVVLFCLGSVWVELSVRVVVLVPSVFYSVLDPSVLLVLLPLESEPPADPPVSEPELPEPSVAGVVVVVPLV